MLFLNDRRDLKELSHLQHSRDLGYDPTPEEDIEPTSTTIEEREEDEDPTKNLEPVRLSDEWASSGPPPR